ncbi:urease accessory protein UreF [Camelimonas abortus]|uniref:Urease accessory protein UreF n=1 Tax=Camelimonas abortus TaxID=1017184 RepID=A0ABV7LFU1_9HYPH
MTSATGMARRTATTMIPGRRTMRTRVNPTGWPMARVAPVSHAMGLRAAAGAGSGGGGGNPFRPPAAGNGGDRLLALLQLASASFPTGAFTQSYGFETWINDGVVADAATAEARCRDWLRFNVATCDAVAMVHAHRAAGAGDVAQLRLLDGMCTALKLGREARAASTMTGRALVAAVRDVFGLEGARLYGEMVDRDGCPGNHAVVYGVAAAGLGLGEGEATTTFLWSALASLVAICQRLTPFGQVEAQRIIARAGDLIDACADIARTRPLHGMSAAFAALDVAGMRHERMPSRLCIS